MREILFRGKRLDNKEWAYGSLWMDESTAENCEEAASISWWSDEKTVWNREEIDNRTIGQYTGLIDKNGVKIYESDIVQDVSVYLAHLNYVETGAETQSQADEYKKYGEIGVVQYNANGDVGSCGCCYPMFVGAGFWAENVDLTKCEVIGNIHDNPELLKGGEAE